MQAAYPAARCEIQRTAPALEPFPRQIPDDTSIFFDSLGHSRNKSDFNEAGQRIARLRRAGEDGHWVRWPNRKASAF